MTITITETPRFIDRDAAWAWYVEAFKDVGKRAIQRHVMTSTEFRDMDEDTRVKKVIVDEDGVILGVSAWTNSMAACPSISQDYFIENHKKEWDNNELYYIVFVGATAGRAEIFNMLIETMYPHVKNGLSFMDFCKWNVDMKRIPFHTRAFLRKLNSSIRIKLVDMQMYYCYWFTDTKPEA